MLTETAIMRAFNATPILSVHEAADQDGYDGGYVAADGTAEAWGETAEKAKVALRRKRGLVKTSDELSR